MKRSLIFAAALLLAAAGAFAMNLAPDATLAHMATATGLASASGATGIALASMALAEPTAQAALRTPAIGDKIEFVAGSNDPSFEPGSRHAGEIAHIWSPSCVNVLIDPKDEDEAKDADPLSRTSVFLRQGDMLTPAGYYAEFAPPA